MPEWIQYVPHINCIKVAKFLGWNYYDGTHCDGKPSDNALFGYDDIKVFPKQWLCKKDGIITVHDEREDA